MHRLSIVAASDLDGQLAVPDCRDIGAGGRTVGHLGSSLALAKREAEASGRQVLTTLHVGDLLGSGALGRFTFELEDGPRRMAWILAQTGLKQGLMGADWLQQDPERLADLLGGLKEHGVSMLNSSISCDDRADCEAMAELPSSVVLSEESPKVVLIGLTPELVFPPGMRSGVRIAPALEVLRKQAREAREQGADLVIAALAKPARSNGEGVLIDLARELSEVDLLITSRLDVLGDSAVSVSPPVGAAIAATGTSTTSAARIDLDVVRRQGRYRISQLRSSPVEASAPQLALEGEARALMREYCDTYDRPLRVRAERAVLPREVLATILDEMRYVARAEVGVAQADLVDRSVFPLFGTISSADIYAALPFDEAVVRVEVSGLELRDIWDLEARRRAQRRSRLVWSGLREQDGVLLVNERPVGDTTRYLLVMPEFLARGGERLLGPPIPYQKLRWEPEKERARPLRSPEEETLLLRELVLRAFSDPKREERSVLDRRELKLEDKTRWTWSYGLTLGANDTRRGNQENYEDSRLLRSAASALRGSFTGQVEADTRDHAFRLSTRARYAQNHVREPTVQVLELEDQIFAEALYRLRRFRRQLDQAWYAPLPYVSATVDSEFFPATDADFRQLGLRSTIGVRFLPWGPLELKLGGGPRRELLDPAGKLSMGVEFGYDLPRFSPFKLRGLPVDIDSNFDYFISELGANGERRHEGRLRGSILLPLGGPFAVNAAADLFMYRKEGGAFAWVSELSLGLTIRFDGAHQRF